MRRSIFITKTYINLLRQNIFNRTRNYNLLQTIRGTAQLNATARAVDKYQTFNTYCMYSIWQNKCFLDRFSTHATNKHKHILLHYFNAYRLINKARIFRNNAHFNVISDSDSKHEKCLNHVSIHSHCYNLATPQLQIKNQVTNIVPYDIHSIKYVEKTGTAQNRKEAL